MNVSENRFMVRICARNYLGVRLILSLITAICSGFVLRISAGTVATLLPAGSWANEIIVSIDHLPAPAYWLIALTSGLGGMVSFFHELRTDVTSLNFLNAFGHMTAAQFAGLMTYLLAVNWELSWPLTLAGAGLAGWGGNRTISALNDLFVSWLGRHFGPPK